MGHNKKKPYEAPALTAVTIRPERGYASSTGILAFDPVDALIGNEVLESREIKEDQYWGNGTSSQWF